MSQSQLKNQSSTGGFTSQSGDPFFASGSQVCGWLLKVRKDSMRNHNFSGAHWRYFTIDFKHRIFHYARSETSKDISNPVKFKDLLEVSFINGARQKSLLSSKDVFAFKVVTRVREMWLIGKTKQDAQTWVNALISARDQRTELAVSSEHQSLERVNGEVQRLRTDNSLLEERLAQVERQKEQELRMKDGQMETTMHALHSMRRIDLQMHEQLQQLQSEKMLLEERVKLLERQKNETLRIKGSQADLHTTRRLNGHLRSDRQIFDEMQRIRQANTALAQQAAVLRKARKDAGLTEVHKSADKQSLYQQLCSTQSCEVAPKAFYITPIYGDEGNDPNNSLMNESNREAEMQHGERGDSQSTQGEPPRAVPVKDSVSCCRSQCQGLWSFFFAQPRRRNQSTRSRAAETNMRAIEQAEDTEVYAQTDWL